MQKIAFITLFWVCFPMLIGAQTGCDIRIKLNNCDFDTLWLARYFGKRTQSQMAAVRQPDGFFELKNDEKLEEGLYAIVCRRYKAASNENFPCWIVNGERQFSLEADMNILRKTTVATGSAENERLYRYLRRYYDLNDSLNDLTINWKGVLDSLSYETMVRAERNLQAFQDQFIAQNTGSRTAKLVETTRFLTPDVKDEKPENWSQKAAKRLEWQQKHFFDRMNLAGDDFLKYPLWVDRTDYFTFKLAMPTPESAIGQIEAVLRQLEPNQVAYRYYFRYIMESLGRISRFQTDEAYVYLVRKYIDTGKSDWMNVGDLEKYRDDASRLEPLFLGKKCPDVTFFDPEGKPVSIYETDAPYLLVAFWMYDCSHCKREIPQLIKLYEKYQSKGLKVMSVCGKGGEEEMPKCWEFAKNMKMPEAWLLLADPQRRSQYYTLLNVRSYPRLLLLDKNKMILYKQTGEIPKNALEKIFQNIIENDMK